MYVPVPVLRALFFTSSINHQSETDQISLKLSNPHVVRLLQATRHHPFSTFVPLNNNEVYSVILSNRHIVYVAQQMNATLWFVNLMQ